MDARTDGPETPTLGGWLRQWPHVEHAGAPRPTVGGTVLVSTHSTSAGGAGRFVAVDLATGTDVFATVYPPASEANGLWELAARRQAIVSDHVVKVLEVGREPASRCLYVFEEFVDGVSAEDWLRDAPDGPCADEASALEPIVAAAKGLAAAHRAGVNHSDVCPRTLLIPRDATGELALARAKLTDFLPPRTNVSGTPGFIAPERLAAEPRADAHSDVFGIGATLYWMLTGHAPFKPPGTSPLDAMANTARASYEPLRKIRPEASDAVAQLIDRCLAPDPSDRYRHGTALLAALEACRPALSPPTGVQ